MSLCSQLAGRGRNTLRSLVLAAPVLTLALTAGSTGAAAQDATTRDIMTAGQQGVANTPMPASSLQVQAWIDRPNGRYALGDPLQLWIQANQPAYVTVLNVGTTGRVTQLFPNTYHTNNYIQANQTLHIPGPNAPYNFSMGGPPGTELIKVVASSQPVPVIQSVTGTQAGAFRSYGATADAVSRDITTVVGSSPQVAWAQVNKPLVVVTTAQQRDVAVATPPAVTPPAAATPAPAVAPFSLQLSTDQPAYKIGQAMQVYVTASKACALTLLNIGTSGNTYVLFPNRFQTNNMIPAGQTVVLPGPTRPSDSSSAARPDRKS